MNSVIGCIQIALYFTPKKKSTTFFLIFRILIPWFFLFYFAFFYVSYAFDRSIWWGPLYILEFFFFNAHTKNIESSPFLSRLVGLRKCIFLLWMTLDDNLKLPVSFVYAKNSRRKRTEWWMRSLRMLDNFLHSFPFKGQRVSLCINVCKL